jgi:hypothetical protein
MTIRQDLRLGISVFGNLTAFKNIDDIIHIGVQYHKGLGVLIAVIISVFIGQEYLWKTWQHKWITSKSRVKIYLSKAMLSMGISALIFLLFEVVILLCSGQISEVFTSEYVSMLIFGILVYSALGAVLCMISMLIENNIMSVITSLGYVLLSETFAALIKNIGSFSDSFNTIGDKFIIHSIYGMSLRLCGTITPENIIFFAINSAVIILLYTAIGLLFFRKYEL